MLNSPKKRFVQEEPNFFSSSGFTKQQAEAIADKELPKRRIMKQIQSPLSSSKAASTELNSTKFVKIPKKGLIRHQRDIQSTLN